MLCGVRARPDCSLLNGHHNATITGVMGTVKKQAVKAPGLTLEPVDRADPMLLHDQVAAEVRRAITDGEARPGERIPQARDLAAELGVNTNTVLRALRILRDEGLLDVGRGKAIVVAGTPETGALVARAKDLIAFARQSGYRREELLALMERIS
jgi:GntR family transcriptional regulator